MNSSRKRIFSNVLFLTGSQALSWLLASFNIIIIPRYLGPDNLGLFTWVTAIGSIIGVVANLGTSTFILREFSRDPEHARNLIGPAIVINVVVGFISWAVGVIILTVLNESGLVMMIFYISAAASLLYLSASPLRAALQGMDKMQFSLFETIIFKGVGTVLTVAVVAFNLGLLMLTITGLISACALILVYWWWFLKYSSADFRKGIAYYKILIRGGMSFLLIDISYNVYLYLDALLLASLTNETIVGYYSVPTRLLGTLLTAPVLIGQALLPTLSRLAKSDAAKAANISRTTLSFLVCLSLPMAVGCSIMAGPFIEFFYTDTYAPSIPILIILGWTGIPLYLGIGLFQILTSQDKQGGWAKLGVMAIFVNGGLNLVFIPYFQATIENGAIGAALALLITETIIDFFGIRLVSRDVVNRQLWGNALKSLGASIIMGIVIWPLRDTWLFIPVFVGALVYGVILMFALNLTGQVRYYISKVTQRLGFFKAQPKIEEYKAVPATDLATDLQDEVVETKSK